MLLAVIFANAIWVESFWLLLLMLLLSFEIVFELLLALSSSDVDVVTSVTLLELIELVEDDAELLVISALLLFIVFVVLWVVIISEDIVSMFAVSLSTSVALAVLINKIAVHIKIIVPK